MKLQSFEAEKSGIPLPENQVEIKGLSRSYQPVSYTHLDVYKRQSYNTPYKGVFP